MKPLLDANHPFFAPVWRRWAASVFPVLWAGVEFYMGSPGWALIFAGAGVWAYWELIYKGPSA